MSPQMNICAISYEIFVVNLLSFFLQEPRVHLKRQMASASKDVCRVKKSKNEQNTLAVVVYKKGLATLIRLSKERGMDTLRVYARNA